MSNRPKFLICNNLTTGKGRQWILHTKKPMLLVESVEYQDSQEAEWLLKENPEALLLDEFGLILLPIACESAPSGIDGVMNRMKDWYKNYLTQLWR